MNSFTIVEQSFYTVYVLQNLLTQAKLELLLARLESWRLSLKAGVSSRKLETWHLCIWASKLSFFILLLKLKWVGFISHFMVLYFRNVDLDLPKISELF